LIDGEAIAINLVMASWHYIRNYFT